MGQLKYLETKIIEHNLNQWKRKNEYWKNIEGMDT